MAKEDDDSRLLVHYSHRQDAGISPLLISYFWYAVAPLEIRDTDSN